MSLKAITKAAVAGAALALAAAMTATPALSQEARGYYEAAAESNDFVLDLLVEKTFAKKAPEMLMVYCSTSITISFPDDDGWTASNRSNKDWDADIKIKANTMTPIVPRSGKMRIVGAQGYELNIIAEF